MKNILSSFILLLCCFTAFSQMSDTNLEERLGEDNVAYQWGKMALDATANDTELFNPRPTITSRFLGLIFTSVFDAWSVYDDNATPVYLEGIAKRPAAEHTVANKEKAISYAAFKALSRPYHDYSGYKPVNTIDKNVDINKWQPKYFEDKYGKPFVPKCLTPYWQNVAPITLATADQYRPSPPPMMGSEQLAEEVKEVVEVHAKLTDEEKALVEFMRDGPKSVQQAGHWLLFAQKVSARDNHTLDQDVKMYFLNQITAMDAFIAAWDSKMHYDYARPYALVHELYKGKEIYGWKGPDEGWGKMDGSEWRPYSPAAFLCPPFPSYVSGHSCVSGACGEALKLFKGSDEFGSDIELQAGYLTEPNHLGKKVTLHFPTFTEAAEMAGQSRVLGGYHIQADNQAGLELGRDVARHAYQFYLRHIGADASMGE